MGLISYFTRHGTVANLLMVAMILVGLIAASQMRAQYFPDVVVNEVDVTVIWEGAGAEEVDRAIVQVLEPALVTVEGVTRVVSRSREGRAETELEFEPNYDLATAEKDVQAVVDALTTLPEDAEDPVVAASGWRDRVTDVLITGPVGVDQLARFADELTNRLFAAGISRVTITGLAAPETLVEVPSVKLMQHDITLAEIAAAIAAATTESPAGEIGDSARLRTGEDRRSTAEIAGIVLRSDPGGGTLTVGDVATILANAPNSERASFVGENPAMSLRVDRADDGDAIRMQATVAEVAAEMQLGLPEGVTVQLVRTRAEQISERLDLILANAGSGFLLVLAVLFLFLNARIAFWVAAGIPIAILASLAGMHGLGLTINMISLFGLFIMIGVVVDDAIVVGEHADFRARNLGEPPALAAENAARRMMAPIMASAITTIIAFLGLLAVGGRFGEMIVAIPITVALVLTASLVENFLVLPHHLKGALTTQGSDRWYDWPSRQVNRGLGWFLTHVLRPVMRLVIVARYPVLAASLVALALQAALFIRGDVPFRFFAPPEQASVSASFSMLPGATRDDTMEMLRELQRAAETVSARFEAEHGTNPATFILADIGGGIGRNLAGAETKSPDQLGSLAMELISPDQRPYPTSAFIAALQAEVVAHPLLEELSFRNSFFGPGGASLSVDFYGGEAETLKAAAEALKAALAGYPEVSGLEDTLAYDKEELILTLTAQGESLGLDTATLGRALRERLGGIEAATFPDGPRQASIRVELPEEEQTADFLDRTLIRTGPGVYVPLTDLVAVESRAGFSTVRRENGQRTVTVSGDLSEDDPARAAEVQRALNEEILPRIAQDFGLGYALSGQAEDERQFLSGAAVGMVLCLAGIFITLTWIFESWTRPLVIMAVIPFGLVGAVHGHWVWDLPLSMFSIVGLVGLTGIIVNGAIVLISTVDDYAKVRPLRQAIVDAMADRFRPLLLTTATTVIGLIPLLYEASSQAQFLKPTVVTLVFGLGFGTFLLMLVVPALIAVQADVALGFTALRRALRRGPGAPRLVIGLATAGIALAGAALPLWVAATGTLPGWLLALVPGLAERGTLPVALGLFLIVGLALWLIAALTAPFLARRSRPSTS